MAWTALRRPSEKSSLTEHKQPELTDNVKRVLVEVGKRSLICTSWHFKSFYCGLGNTGISIRSWCICCGVIELYGKHVEPIKRFGQQTDNFACMSSIDGSLECKELRAAWEHCATEPHRARDQGKRDQNCPASIRPNARNTANSRSVQTLNFHGTGKQKNSYSETFCAKSEHL